VLTSTHGVHAKIHGHTHLPLERVLSLGHVKSSSDKFASRHMLSVSTMRQKRGCDAHGAQPLHAAPLPAPGLWPRRISAVPGPAAPSVPDTVSGLPPLEGEETLSSEIAPKLRFLAEIVRLLSAVGDISATSDMPRYVWL